MIKRLMTVRSREKLFLGLAFALSGFSLAYTLLTIMVLPKQILLNGPITRYVLLLLPCVGILICIAALLIRKTQPESLPVKTAVRQFCCGIAFCSSLFLLLWQINLLDQAKQIIGFSPIILFLTALATTAYCCYGIFHIIQARQEK